MADLPDPRYEHGVAVLSPLPAGTPGPRPGWAPVFERDNHRVEQRGRCVWVSVWQPPDLDTRTTAALAATLLDTLIVYLGGRSPWRLLVLDLRLATPPAGGLSFAGLVRLLQTCERAAVSVVVLHSGEPLPALQLGRLVREHAPRSGQLLRDPYTAQALALRAA